MRIIVLFAALLSGCSTLFNVTSHYDPEHPIFYTRNEVYGGVKLALKDGAESVSRPGGPGEFLLGAFLLAVDAPLCLVADTVTLPITIPAQIERKNKADEFPENWRPKSEPHPATVEDSQPALETRLITDPL